MTDMICGNCGRTGIRWMGPLSNLTHTECPHCGGRNCQLADMPDDEPTVWCDLRNSECLDEICADFGCALKAGSTPDRDETFMDDVS